ncbi:MAG: serine/threonine protein kinase [Deltaproteobacteria bacterium]|nr:serine/threonine protein kinase [Deltaproteobacteria bacterium]
MPPEDGGFEDDEPSHPSLALGTHDAAGRDERTRVESPSAQKKAPSIQPAPAPRAAKPPPIPRGGTQSEEPERLGSVLGSYRVLELLGKGGMGYVFRAEHIKLGREVALKLLRSDYARRRDAVARFFQEARTVNRVRHRNIVDVTDFVELDDGTTFIIMEFLRGQSLGKWARTGIDLPRALAVLVQICDGLGAAHQVGVVHRDLKPDNVIVVPTSDGAELVKLLDFGVAKLLNRDDEDVGFQTAAGSVIGTPAYMSPEQAGGMVVDARSDIYSLGAIMYELFCGQPMFRGRSFGEYVRKHLTEMPIAPRATEAGRTMDPILEMLIMRCLEKDPDQRFGQILELRDALLGMLGGMETHPPGFANLTMSGLRAPPMASYPAPLHPGVLPPMLPTMIPQAPVLHQPTPSPSQLSGPHAGRSSHSGAHAAPHAMAQSSIHYGYYSQVAPPAVQATPWWVWLVGGSLAIGLGISAAVWYAGRAEPGLAPATAVPAGSPSAAPLEQAPVTPQVFELRFEAQPSGGVYAEGQAAELCRTPCAHNIDLRDGRSTERRTFVVRATGHKDKLVHVDLTAPQREFRVTLDLLETIPTPPGQPGEPGAARPDEAPRPLVPTRDERSSDAKRGSRTSKVTKPAKQTEVASPVEPEPEPVPVKQPEPAPVTKVEPTKVEPKVEPKKVDKIDPSDTLDPFRRKRSAR